jgi:hypothetical protein
MDTAKCHWNIFGLPLEYWIETVILGRVKPAKPQVCKQFRMGVLKSDLLCLLMSELCI